VDHTGAKEGHMLVKVLVSHAHDESTLAGAWKDLLEGISAGVIQVWFSSDLAPSGGLSVGQNSYSPSRLPRAPADRGSCGNVDLPAAS
jgi:hypothetical protein